MPTKPAAKPDTRWKIIEAALALARTHGWRTVTLAAIARESGQSLDKLVAEFPSKPAILAAFNRRIDAEMVKGPVEDGSSVKDRLFELIMRRLDALSPHRDAVRAILRDTVGVDPVASLMGLCSLHRSMALALEAAGVSASGPLGRLRANALAAIYLRALRLWLRDADGSADRVMADLDKSLTRAERLATSFGSRRGRWRTDDSAKTPVESPG
jgi:AcrR family transcriptional regulator